MTMLENIERLRRCIVEKKRVAEQLHAMTPAPAPIAMDGLPHGTGGGDGVERYIDARDALRRRIDKLQGEIDTRYRATAPFVESIPTELLGVLCNYYFNDYTVLEVATALSISKRTVYERLEKIKTLAQEQKLYGNPEQWG